MDARSRWTNALETKRWGPATRRPSLRVILPALGPADIVTILDVVREVVHFDRAKASLGEYLDRLLPAPHGAQPLAALLGQRHGHAVHARDGVEQRAYGMIAILVHMAGTVDVLRQINSIGRQRAANAAYHRARIAAAVGPEITLAEIERVRTRRPKTLDAWDYYLRAISAFHKMTKEDTLLIVHRNEAGPRQTSLEYGEQHPVPIGAPRSPSYAMLKNSEGPKKLKY